MQSQVPVSSNLNNYQDKNVIILGGMGFIGSNLAHLLVNQGANVTLVDNFLPDHGANWQNLAGIAEQVKVQLSDLRNPESLRVLLKNQDYIFNIAAQTSHSDSMLQPELDLDINCRGNLIFLEACRAVNPEARILFAGTRAFYGAPPQLPVNESSPILPRDIYSVNRFAAEQYHLLYHLHYGLRTSSIRIANLYGPRGQMQHPRYNVLNYFVRLALEDQTIQVYGEGQQRRDYLFVADVSTAMAALALCEKASGQVYNLGSGQGMAFIDLVRAVLAEVGLGQYETRAWPPGAQAYDVGDFIMDISKIQAEIDWSPQTSLKEGLAATVEFYRQNRSHYW